MELDGTVDPFNQPTQPLGRRDDASPMECLGMERGGSTWLSILETAAENHKLVVPEIGAKTVVLSTSCDASNCSAVLPRGPAAPKCAEV